MTPGYSVRDRGRGKGDPIGFPRRREGQEVVQMGKDTIGIEIHRGIEAAIGLALVILPILLGYAPGSPLSVSVEAVFVAGLFGLVLATLGLVYSRDGDALPPSLHRGLDAVAATALVAATIIFALRSNGRADVVILALAAFPYAVMVLCTRYVPGERDTATTVSKESAAD